MNGNGEALQRLLNAAAVRERAHEMLDLALQGTVEGWAVDLARLDDAAELTASVTRESYPDLAIPYHARWRHFVAGPTDFGGESGLAARARARFDLVILSVLLDAGAGPDWSFNDPVSGARLSRSEGLAVASQRLFEAGAFSDRPDAPLRADGAVLAGFSDETLVRGFQVDAANPMVGLEGRTALLRRLGAQVLARPDLFATEDVPRPGGLYDVLAARAQGGRLPAPQILELLLEALGPIWAGRLVIDGVALGDCWRHPAIRRSDASDGLVPLHKLSQWLAYSLIEPLEAAELDVVDVDGLTGLAEYRNGGLFVDTGVLRLTDPDAAGRTHLVSDPLIVAWRAMTVALLDRLAPRVRTLLGVSEAGFPLARMLEGGTWTAGRRIAAERRADGGPPFSIISDGTVF
ncbi:MAG: URC4/urg3 family protein [Allosphingosinicella sp.]